VKITICTNPNEFPTIVIEGETQETGKYGNFLSPKDVAEAFIDIKKKLSKQEEAE